MRTYNCLVQLGANKGGPNPHHEVPRFNVPRAEIVLLRSIHGADAVTQLKPVGETDENIEDMDIYRAMAESYPKHINLIERLNNIILEDLNFMVDDLERGLDDDLDKPEPEVVSQPAIPANMPVADSHAARRNAVDELA